MNLFLLLFIVFLTNSPCLGANTDSIFFDFLTKNEENDQKTPYFSSKNEEIGLKWRFKSDSVNQSKNEVFPYIIWSKMNFYDHIIKLKSRPYQPSRSIISGEYSHLKWTFGRLKPTQDPYSKYYPYSIALAFNKKHFNYHSGFYNENAKIFTKHQIKFKKGSLKNTSVYGILDPHWREFGINLEIGQNEFSKIWGPNPHLKWHRVLKSKHHQINWDFDLYYQGLQNSAYYKWPMWILDLQKGPLLLLKQRQKYQLNNFNLTHHLNLASTQKDTPFSNYLNFDYIDYELKIIFNRSSQFKVTNSYQLVDFQPYFEIEGQWKTKPLIDKYQVGLKWKLPSVYSLDLKQYFNSRPKTQLEIKLNHNEKFDRVNTQLKISYLNLEKEWYYSLIISRTWGSF